MEKFTGYCNRTRFCLWTQDFRSHIGGLAGKLPGERKHCVQEINPLHQPESVSPAEPEARLAQTFYTRQKSSHRPVI